MSGVMAPNNWYVAAYEEEWLGVLDVLEEPVRRRVKQRIERRVVDDDMILIWGDEVTAKTIAKAFTR